MLVLSLLFVAVMVLLVFSFTKDTGRNTVHARKSTHNYVTAKSTPATNERRTLAPTKIAKAS